MRVIVHSHYSETEASYEGSPSEVYEKLLERFPQCASTDPEHANDVPALVEHIDSMQAYSAEIQDNPELAKSDTEDSMVSKPESPLKTPEGFKAYIAQFRARQDLLDRRIEHLVGTTRGSAWSKPDGSHIVVGMDPHNLSQWRATRIAPDGEPHGHDVSYTHAGALKLAHEAGCDIHGQPVQVIKKSELGCLLTKFVALRKYEHRLWPWIQSLVKSEGNLADDDLGGASEIAMDMIGFNPLVHPVFAGAQFLAGGKPLSMAEIRQALYDQDGDYEEAAIQAYRLPDTDETRRALKAVLGISSLAKAEVKTGLPEGKDVEPGLSDAKDAATEVRRAFMLKNVKVAHLDGKHSKGSLIAKDSETQNVYLLKPGSGGQSPASGAQEEHASQSRREAAFWHVADQWNLGETIPKADLILVDGREYAAIRMLPFSYKNLEKKATNDPALAQRALAMYRDKGFLHKWAVLDFVLGNPDRHGQNLMISADDKTVAMIDHGSAFAGDSFDPAFDRNSFVPYYLRAWGGPRFNGLPVKDKLTRMPSVSTQTRAELHDWLSGIHADRLEATLLRFGIDPRASVARLARLKVLAGTKPLDQAINSLWVTT